MDVSGLTRRSPRDGPNARIPGGRLAEPDAREPRAFQSSSPPITTLDTYLIHNPDQILGEVEATTFDPANPYVMTPHLCAASEKALTAEDALCSADSTELFDALAEEGYLRKRSSGWYWNVALPMRAQDLTDLRGSSGEVQVVEESTGTVIGTVASDQANAQVPRRNLRSPRAHLPGNRTDPRSPHRRWRSNPNRIRRARALFWSDPSSHRPANPTHGSNISSDFERGGQIGTSDDGVIRWSFGEVEVESQVTDFDTLRLPGMQFISNTKLDMA